MGGLRHEMGALRQEMREDNAALRADLSALQGRMVNVLLALAVALIGALAGLVATGA